MDTWSVPEFFSLTAKHGTEILFFQLKSGA